MAAWHLKNRIAAKILIGSAALFVAAIGWRTVSPPAVAGTETLQVVSVTPSGEDVPAGRQIVIQFNRDVVPLGRMERTAEEVPVLVTPPLACRWRWLNRSALACQLNEKEAMRPATRYTLTVKPDLVAEDGAKLSQEATDSFLTLRPESEDAAFIGWAGPTRPVLRVTFNQPVTQSSVEKSLYFEEKEKKGTRHALRAEVDPQNPEQESREDGTIKTGRAYRNWIVSAVENLPQDAEMMLSVSPGLISAEGPEPGVEEGSISQFATFPEFNILGVHCSTSADDNTGILIPLADILKKKTGWACNPQRSIGLVFNTPVQSAGFRDSVAIRPPVSDRKDFDPWAGRVSERALTEAHSKGAHYTVWLPLWLSAETEYRFSAQPAPEGMVEAAKALLSKQSAAVLTDYFGRPLKGGFDFTIRTSARDPDILLPYQFAVQESQIPGDLPLYVQNLDSVELEYRTLTAKGLSDVKTKILPVPPDVRNVRFAVPFSLRELLGPESGLVRGTLTPVPSIPNMKAGLRFQGEITPWAAHVKLGHHNTLVWVTDLATGKPVANATVRLLQQPAEGFSSASKPDREAQTDSEGLALLDGTAVLGSAAPMHVRYAQIVKEGAMAVVPLDWAFNLPTYRVSESIASGAMPRYGHIRAWGASAQGVYRAGEKIQYKIYVRDQDNRKFVPAPAKSYTLRIVDPTGLAVEERKELTLNDFGAIDGNYTPPESARVGWYEFYLSADFITTGEIPAMRVLVSDYTPAMFHVETALDGERFEPGQSVPVKVEAVLHAGGAYDNAEVRVTGKVEYAPFHSDNPAFAGVSFDGSYGETLSSFAAFEKVGRLDASGKFAEAFTLPAQEKVGYGRLVIESAVRDDRGAYISSYNAADYIGVDRLVGLRVSNTVGEAKKPFVIEYGVADTAGNPVTGSNVSIAIERLDRKTARVRGPGNAYITETTENWVPAGGCEGVSSAGLSRCQVTPEVAGDYRVMASVTDTKGRISKSGQPFWVTGVDYVPWDNKADYTLKIIPQNKDLKVGDTARFLIENPFPGAQALISVERLGIMRHWVKTLETSAETIEIPIEADDVPGFYLSVVVFSPRVTPPPEDRSVDLGKPTLRMGYLSVPVGDLHKQISMSASVEREVYQPREKVRAVFQVTRPAGQEKVPVELAVVALDEAVLDLIQGGADYYDPYKGFYMIEPLDVENYNILMQLVGRQYIEKKGANAGGDGGASLGVRNLFKSIGYWNPSVPVDEKGEARIEFEAPDNLTGWRIFAMAVTPGDRMGLGQTAFKVNRKTEIRPLVPNQILEGDQFSAVFDIRNRTDQKRTLTVEIVAQGDIKQEESATTVQKIDLEPFSSGTVSLALQSAAVKQSPGTAEGTIRFTVRAHDTIDEDAFEQSVPVLKRRTLVTAAEYGMLSENAAKISIAVPDGIYPDSGEISVLLAPSVIGNVSGAFRYMKEYPYQCWEQKLSKGVMAAQYESLHAYLPEDMKWDGTGKLIEDLLKEAPGFQAADGGMTYFGGDESYVDPYLTAYTALAISWLKAGGYTPSVAFESALQGYLRNFLSEEASPEYYTRGMASSVRAVMLAALAKGGLATQEDLERYKPALDDMDLFGLAHYLQAAVEVEGGDPYAKAARTKILAHVNQSGGKVSLTETIDDSFSRILTSPLRSECAVLDAFLAAPQEEEKSDLSYKLVRAIVQARGSRDHWENTQENLFCMNALSHYARRYEKNLSGLAAAVSFDSKTLGEASFSSVRDPAQTVGRPLAAQDIGKKSVVELKRTGTGRLYYATRLRYAPEDKAAQAVNSGIEIRREVSVLRDGKWEIVSEDKALRQGELIRVDLFLSLPGARNFVVVEDPVPGGIEPINRDLATTSAFDADKANVMMSSGSYWFEFNDWQSYGVTRWSFYHSEIGHDSVRFYADYLEPGNYYLSWTGRAIAGGTFGTMPPRAEEMYDPDVFGLGMPMTLRIEK